MNRCLKNPQISNFMKMSSGNRVVPRGQTEMTELIVAFCNLQTCLKIMLRVLQWRCMWEFNYSSISYINLSNRLRRVVSSRQGILPLGNSPWYPENRRQGGHFTVPHTALCTPTDSCFILTQLTIKPFICGIVYVHKLNWFFQEIGISCKMQLVWLNWKKNWVTENWNEDMNS